LTTKQLSSLQYSGQGQNSWLDTDIVNTYLDLLKTENNHIFNSYLCQRIDFIDEKNIKEALKCFFLKTINIFKFKYIFLPIIAGKVIF